MRLCFGINIYLSVRVGLNRSTVNVTNGDIDMSFPQDVSVNFFSNTGLFCFHGTELVNRLMFISQNFLILACLLSSFFSWIIFWWSHKFILRCWRWSIVICRQFFATCSTASKLQRSGNDYTSVCFTVSSSLFSEVSEFFSLLFVIFLKQISPDFIMFSISVHEKIGVCYCGLLLWLHVD